MRRFPTLVVFTAGLVTLMAGAWACSARADSPEITVYRSPTCGCCGKWVDHLRSNGFSVSVNEVANLKEVKATNGVPEQLVSCHTALVDGYVVEGHVPASVIQRLLKERPDVAGIAVPGMPMGSPGMEGPRSEPYNVMSFDEKGRVAVYSRH